MDMNVLKSEIKTLNWSHLSPRNAEIMARWEIGETYKVIADTIKVSRSTVAGVVLRNNGRVVKTRDYSKRAKRSYSTVGRPNMYDAPVREDPVQLSAYKYTPILAFRQAEVDQKIESRGRLLGALRDE